MSKRLRMGPLGIARLMTAARTYSVPGERPLDADEWVQVCAAIGMGYLAALNQDAEVWQECRDLVDEAGVRSGLPVQVADIIVHHE